ncbi:MAG: hypothetical protein KDE31_11690, partial [Caldilineaceae bacterium]|nr:hypothetical protein [Caldilineaceae bacterium]
YDGSTQIVHMAGSKSATAQTYAKSISKSGKAVLLVGPEDNVTLAEAAISSLSATGIELTWSTLPSTAVYLTVTAAIFDNVTVRSVTQPAENSTTTVNDLGYDPDLLLVFSSFTTLGNAIAQPMRFSFGFHTASSDMAASYHERTFAADSEPTNRLGTDYALYRTQQGALDLYQGDLALVTGGFTYQSLDEAGAGDVTVVAIDTGSTGTSVQVVDTPTSTGAANLFGSALAFQPGMVLAFGTWRSAVDADGAAGATDGDAGAWAITQAIDGAEYSTAWAIEDAQATTDTQSLSDNQWLNMPDDSGANAITVTGATWGSDNVALTWGAVDGTARKMLVLAVELIEVDPSGTDYFQTSMRSGLTVGMP